MRYGQLFGLLLVWFNIANADFSDRLDIRVDRDAFRTMVYIESSSDHYFLKKEYSPKNELRRYELRYRNYEITIDSEKLLLVEYGNKSFKYFHFDRKGEEYLLTKVDFLAPRKFYSGDFEDENPGFVSVRGMGKQIFSCGNTSDLLQPIVACDPSCDSARKELTEIKKYFKQIFSATAKRSCTKYIPDMVSFQNLNLTTLNVIPRKNARTMILRTISHWVGIFLIQNLEMSLR